MVYSLPFSNTERQDLAEAVTDIVDRAAELILDIYNTDFEVRYKDDGSPVTDADQFAEELIVEELKKVLPGIDVIGEETLAKNSDTQRNQNTFWLVDPIDGTKEFIKKNGEFTINIALIQEQSPILGVVGAPALNCTYRAHGLATSERREHSNIWQRISAKTIPLEGCVAISSRSHSDKTKLQNFLPHTRIQTHEALGSSLKFCRVAEGAAHIYPRYGATREWDTAAGHAILLGAGGGVFVGEHRELRYGKKDWINPEFIARART